MPFINFVLCRVLTILTISFQNDTRSAVNTWVINENQQGIHRHQTPPRYRNSSPYGPLRPNMTSSIKPEVHNVSQRRQRRTEPRPQGSAHKISREDRSSGSREMLAERQTHTQTDTRTDIQIDRNIPLRYRGGVTRFETLAVVAAKIAATVAERLRWLAAVTLLAVTTKIVNISVYYLSVAIYSYLRSIVAATIARDAIVNATDRNNSCSGRSDRFQLLPLHMITV